MANSRKSAPAPRAPPWRNSTFAAPRTVSHPALLDRGGDDAFRETLYLMVLALGHLADCREAFGRAMGLTGSQFAVMIGTAYRQQTDGVSIRAIADYVQLAPPHVTTEVGRLIRKGLLVKRINPRDRRGVLVRLSRRGEEAIREVAPLVREINDILFESVSRKDFAALSAFLRKFARNGERAVDEIRRRGRSRPD
ncbi:MAG: MarR family transcriptional regulator [Alphaproteobacteria bacterium]|nr:MarR family transcriptional regulator [Alphaproteobacteria bacterium]